MTDLLSKTRRRIEGRFVEVNWATLRRDAAMSALFEATDFDRSQHESDLPIMR